MQSSTVEQKIIDIFSRFSLIEMVEVKLKHLVRLIASSHNKGELYYQVISEVEEALIKLTLDEVGYNQSKAAQILGLNRNTLRKKMQEFGLTKKTE